MVRSTFPLALLATLAAFGAAPASGDEAKVPVSASMMLKIMSTPIEARETAFDRSLKEAGPPPRPSLAEVLPDGSVKVDRAVITVRNPCPPGTTHYEPVPLPGRRAKN
jgi:hypothetical protein